MKIEKGMYVRTKKGEIAKIEKIEKDIGYKNMEYITLDRNLPFEDERFHIYKEDIKEASYNIIDLIKVGDYVNGEKIKPIYLKTYKEQGVFGYPDEDHLFIKKMDIESIVTHEQFKNIKYEVEE